MMEEGFLYQRCLMVKKAPLGTKKGSFEISLKQAFMSLCSSNDETRKYTFAC